MSILLDGIETFNEDPSTEQLGELYLTLVLAFNLQYMTLPPVTSLPFTIPEANQDSDKVKETNQDIKENSKIATLPNGNMETEDTLQSKGADMENVIIKHLGRRETTKYFTEKLLLLFNREGESQSVIQVAI